MTPAIVLRNGKVRIVTGSPGGRTIPNTTLWVIWACSSSDWTRAAVDAPRTHHQWFPDVLLLEGESWTETVRAELAAMGHHWRSTDRLGIANTIVVDPSTGQVHGIADRRRSTTKAAGD